MAGSSIAGMIVGTVFIVIFASATAIIFYKAIIFACATAIIF